MNKIDTTNWENFKIGNLFDIHPTKAYKFTNAQLFEEDGKNPVIVNSSYNNGIGGYTNLDCTEKAGIITFSDTTSADAIFYQENNFVGYSHVQGMYPIGLYKDKWSKYSLLFFVSVFKNKAYSLGFDYVNKFTRDAAKEISIKLPATDSGEPDFSYMEQYMKNLEITVCSTLTELQSAPKLKEKSINTIDWYEFTVEQISDSVNIAKSYDFGKLREGKTPFINRSGNNNGIQGFVNVEPTEKKNCITVGMVGNSKSAFWQTVDFATSQNILIIRNNKLNEFSGRFLCSVLNSLLKEMRDYTTIIKKDEFKKQKIKLPAISPLEPDWEYMEQYMKNIEKQVNQSIEALTCVIK